MKARLLYRDRDLPWRPVLEAAEARERERARRRPEPAHAAVSAPRPWNAEDLVRDLRLDAVFDAMARDDALVRESSATVILGAAQNDAETIRYRQSVLRDCLAHPDTVRRLYALATEVGLKGREQYLGSLLTRHPDWSIRHSSRMIDALLEPIVHLRDFADRHSGDFASEGWQHLFAAIRADLGDRRLGDIKGQLEALRFRDGILLSARLGAGNKGDDYRLHRTLARPGGRIVRLLNRRFPRLFGRLPQGAFDFEIDPRDESGARALADVRNRGLAIAATSLGQATDHVRDFFAMLRCELAFYVGCLNLDERLREHGAALCFPTPCAEGPHRLCARNLRDACLVLDGVQPVVGNDLDAKAKELIVITGANQGGKSTFLRSVGLGQLMMQAGLFVAAESFEASLCDGLFTHFRREEDAGLEKGKLEEELARMSKIVDHAAPEALILCNESFAATNERDGSEIARQISTALLERRMRLVFVTHLYEFARAMHELAAQRVMFLGAVREEDGTRSFRLREGAPLETGFAADLYARIFDHGTAERREAGRRAGG